MSTKFADLSHDSFVGGIARELQAIHEKHGSPEAPTGPSTEAKLDYSPAQLDAMGDGWEQHHADAWNAAVWELWKLLDYRHIGSGIVYTSYEPGTAEWRAYQEEAREALEEWLQRYAWDLFCDLPDSYFE